MPRLSRRLIVLFLVLGLGLIAAVPAAATEGSTEEDTTETTVAPEPVFENGEPAVIIPPTEEVEEDQPWTARFLYPLIVVLTIVLIIALAIWYNRNIRRKYEVVAE